MSPVNLLQLIFLAALWGASFLFIRVGVVEFGVAPLMARRVDIGALFLIAMCSSRDAASRKPSAPFGSARCRCLSSAF